MVVEAPTSKAAPVEFHNTGLYNIAGPLSYPAPTPGSSRSRSNPEDVGKFKAPTLRNIAVTAPYMHDGSVATLEDAIDHYAAGGRTIAEARYRRRRPRQSRTRACSMRGFTLTAEQRPTCSRSCVADRRGAASRPAIREPVESGGVLPGELSMALSARNHLPGIIDEIVMGDVLADITVRVGEHVIESGDHPAQRRGDGPQEGQHGHRRRQGDRGDARERVSRRSGRGWTQ